MTSAVTGLRFRIALRTRAGLLVFACLLGPGFCAGAASEAPIEALRRHLEQALAVLRLPCAEDPACPSAKLARLREIAADAVDFHEFSRRAFSFGWAELTPDGRAAFAAEFTGFLLAAHLPRALERYTGEEVRLLDERLLAPGKAAVRGLLRGAGFEIPFEVRLKLRGETWAAYDVEAFGISAVVLYRAQLAALRRALGSEQLLDLLRRRREAGAP